MPKSPTSFCGGELDPRAKLTDAQVRAIRERTANRRPYHGEPLKALAADFGVSIGAISGIIKGRTWKHIL